MRKLSELRKQYPVFSYKKYSWKISKGNLNISFSFKVAPATADLEAGPFDNAQGKPFGDAQGKPDISFKPKVVIENISKTRLKTMGESQLNNLVFHLGLAEIPSYWKVTCSKEIRIEAGGLDRQQMKWWKDLILNGMDQFFFENKINFRGVNFLKISSLEPGSENGQKATIAENKVLVPLGGGKDSIVTLEILKNAGKNITCFSLNPTENAQQVMKVAGCQKSIIVRRTIDPKLLEMNKQGFLNGHTPFSSYLAFLSVLSAAIFDFKYIALSNERSSNEGNVRYLGKEINHQWSKSFDFENKFRDYTKKYLADVEYFSFLRPLYEFQIAKIFSRLPKYFSSFLSCNEAFKTISGTRIPSGKWCGNCPKCLFVFACLYPFLEKEALLKIFGQNLFIKQELLPVMLELLGLKDYKPFECVGTKKESLIAFYLSWQKAKTAGESPFLLKYFENKILKKHPDLEEEAKKLLESWDNQNCLPKEFEKILKAKIF